MEKLVSIIVPVYNEETYIEECLRSLLNQTYQNIEIIVVDDGSFDNCNLICQKLQQEDDRIRIAEINHQGILNACNLGLQLALGDYISFVNCMDVVSDDYISILVDNITKYDAQIAIGQYTRNKDDLHKSKGQKTFVGADSDIIATYLDNVYFNDVNTPKLYSRHLLENPKFNQYRQNDRYDLVYKEIARNINRVIVEDTIIYYFRNR